MRIPSGTTDRYIYFVAVDPTDLKTRETGLSSFTVYRSRNGGASAAMTTPTVNETDTTNMPGVYELLLDEDTTLAAGNDAEEMCFHITHGSMAPVTRTVEIYRPETTEGNTLDVTATGAGGIDWGNVENQGTSVNLSSTTTNLVNTTTTNTDMRGTDSAALASVVGALADSAAAGDPTASDTLMAYVKQLINTLEGTTGIPTFPAEAAPANNVSLAEVIRAIHADVTGLNGDAMRGTDNALTSNRHVLQETTIASLTSQTEFTLTAGSADDAAYAGCSVVIEDASTATQKAVVPCDTYTGSTKTVVLTEAPAFTIATTDNIYILADTSLKPNTLADFNVEVSPAGKVSPNFNLAFGSLGNDHVDWVDANDRVNVGQWLDNAVTASGGVPDINVQAIDDIDAPATWKTSINAECDTALSDIGLDHLLSVAVVGTDVTDDSVVAQLVSASATSDWDDFDNTTDSLQAIRDRGDAAWTTGAGGSDRLLMVDTTIASLTSQTQFTLTAGSADDNAYRGCTVVIEDASTSTQKAIGICDTYTGSTKEVVLLQDPGVFTMATTDKVYILAEKGVKPTTANDYHLNITSNGRIDVGQWLGSAVNALVSGRVDSSVGAMAANTLTSTAIAGAAITASKLAANAIGASQIASNAITAAKIATDAITATKIATDAITAAKIATDAIDADALAADAVAEINATVDTALADIKLDHLIAVAETDEAVDNSIIAKLASATSDWSTFTASTDSLEAIRDRGDAAWTTGAGGSDRLLMVDTTIATLTSQTEFTLTAGSADDSAYEGCTVVIEDAATATQKAIGICDTYTGSTKTVILLEDPGVFTMAATDKVYVLAEKGLKPTTSADYHVDVSSNGTVGVDLANVTGTLTQANVGWVDANSRVDVGSWLGTAVTTSSTTAKPEVDVFSISDDSTAANNAELDYDGTGYNKSNSTIGTTTTNTDMRGTDDAFLAASAPTNFSSMVISAGGAADCLVQGFLNNTIAETTADRIAGNFEVFWDNADVLTTKTVDDVGTGGGDATAANQTTIINHLTDVKGAGWTSTDTLENIYNDTNELQIDWVDGGRLDLIVDAILVDTNSLNDIKIPDTISLAAINAEVDTALVDIGLDHLVSAAVVGTDVIDNSIFAYITSKAATADWDTFVNTTDSLEAIRDNQSVGSGLTALATGTAQGGTATTIQLAASETFADDELIGNIVKITSGTGAGQSRPITDYVGATDTATVQPDWTTNPDATSVYEIVEGKGPGYDISPVLIDDSRTWFVRAGSAGYVGDQVLEGQPGLSATYACNFKNVLNPKTSISSVSSVVEENAASITIGTASVSQDALSVHIPLSALVDAITYRFKVIVVTTDNQTLAADVLLDSKETP